MSRTNDPRGVLMNQSSTKHWVIVLYVLADILVATAIIPFLYQYIAAAESYSDVIPAFGNAQILTALWLSLLSAFAVTFLAIIFGVPLAYFFARKEFPGESLLGYCGG